ncbi:MAG TPA: leucine efflux protein LeuE [Usitatibacter sp.]|nr:leucine efflux protein LeuE [Usitatibacter sp.]
MFYGITDLATYILGTIFIVLLPGPNSMYVMTVAARHGVAPGWRAACGVFLGDAVLMVLAAAGAASLLRTTPALFAVVKFAGASYLGWVGIGLLRAAVSTWRGHSRDAAPGAAADATRPFRTALLVSLMNPKAILFFVSFFVQFVDPAYERPALSFAILGAILQVFSVAYLSLLIFAGARLAAQLRRRRRLSAAATGGIGGLFVGFGARLAGATLG